MKKFLGVLLVSVLGLVLYMPYVKAATEVTFNCKKTCELTESDMCQSTCTLGFTGNTGTITTFNAQVLLSPESAQMGELKLNEGWSNMGNANNPTNLQLIATPGVTEKDFTIGSFTVTVPRVDAQGNTVKCNITLQPEGFGTVEQVVTTETQPSTGVTLPLIILGCGFVLAIGAYYITRKNTKMYKI